MRAKSVLIAAAALLFAGNAQAQLVWDLPTFLPPQPGEDIGIYLTLPDGVDWGLEGIWRQQGNLNLGVRFGYLDAEFGDGAFLAGAETWGGLVIAGADFPLDVAWTLGLGAVFDDDFTIFSVPAGLSLGRTLVLDPLTIQVYGHPRLALVAASAGDDTETDVEGYFDIGADLHLNPDWKLRLGVTLGGHDAWGLGLAYRFGRGVTVR